VELLELELLSRLELLKVDVELDEPKLTPLPLEDELEELLELDEELEELELDEELDELELELLLELLLLELELEENNLD